MRSALERRLRDRLTEDGYLFPDYGGYCFARIPDTVRSVLPVDARDARPPDPLPDEALDGFAETYDRVLVILVDGFGIDAWKRHADDPFLERFADAGRVTPLTTIYPSETAAAITTFHTGRLPAEHGVIGWNVYEPSIDAAFQAFDVRPKGGREPIDVEPPGVIDGDPIYPALDEAGVDCRHVVPFEETYAGATAHTYELEELDEFGRRLDSAFDAGDGPAYLFAYLPHVDHAAHAHGTASTAYRGAVRAVFDAIESAIDAIDAKSAGETLVVLTADHGHVDTDPDRNVDLEEREAVMANLERHADGEPVRFAGSPRNVHLHLREGTIENVRERLLAELDARVFTRDEVLDRGLFGHREPSGTFRRRLGDLVLTHRDLGTWYGAEAGELELVGMHGGLHADEMLVPFAAAELDALRS